MSSLSSQILRRARAHAKGQWVFSASDFLDLGQRAAVDQALSRLAKTGKARRVRRGLYDLPRTSTVLKKPAPPSLDATVAAIARRDNVRILPDGMTAASKLGLTTAVPAKARFLTDGATKTLTIAGRTVHFRHASPKVMYWADRPAATLVQALRWLGADAASSPQVWSVLKRSLRTDVSVDLAKGAHLLPQWASHLTHKLLDEQVASA